MMVPPSTHSLFLQCYDLRLQLREAEGTIYSKWECVTNFLLQLKEFDDTIAVLPWASQDQDCNPPITIQCISESFFDLSTYVPGLANTNVSQQT